MLPITAIPTRIAQVTDTNGRDAGKQFVHLDVENGVVRRMALCNDSGRVYFGYGGRTGESLGNRPTSAPAGTPMFELHALGSDERAWVDADGKFVHLD